MTHLFLCVLIQSTLTLIALICVFCTEIILLSSSSVLKSSEGLGKVYRNVENPEIIISSLLIVEGVSGVLCFLANLCIA